MTQSQTNLRRVALDATRRASEPKISNRSERVLTTTGESATTGAVEVDEEEALVAVEPWVLSKMMAVHNTMSLRMEDSFSWSASMRFYMNENTHKKRRKH